MSADRPGSRPLSEWRAFALVVFLLGMNGLMVWQLHLHSADREAIVRLEQQITNLGASYEAKYAVYHRLLEKLQRDLDARARELDEREKALDEQNL